MNRKCCETPRGAGPHAPGCANNPATKPAAVAGDAPPSYSRPCVVCGCKPILVLTQMCGPCTFDEAKTAGGNW